MYCVLRSLLYGLAFFVVVGFTQACGGDSSTSPSSVSVTPGEVAGEWTVGSGTEETNCGSGVTTEPVSGTLQLDIGTNSDLEIDRSLVVGSRGCIIQFDLTGNIATARPLTCSERVPMFDIRRVTVIREWTMTFTDGSNMTRSSVTTTSISGDPGECVFTIRDARYNKG